MPNSLILVAGDLPGGGEMVHTALCVEPRDGMLHVFMPPLTELEPGHWVACHFPEIVQVV